MKATRFRLVKAARLLVIAALLALPGVIYALSGGSLGNADAQFLGEAADDSAGYSVAGAGDVNGDGYDDLLIGALKNDAGGTDAGAAYLVLGGPGGWGLGTDLGSAGIIKYTGEAAGDDAGWSVAGAGDVDGDGYADLLIGADKNDAGGSDAGAAYLVLGSASPSDLTLNVTNTIKYSGEAAGDRAGYSVAGAGDVNGDGYADLLIGALKNDAGGTDAGAAYLVLGSVSPSDLTLSAANAIKYSGEVAGDWAGCSVAGAGDVNGDGYDDLLIGAKLNDAGEINAGAAYLVLGSASPSDLTLSAANATKYTGEAVDDWAGTSVAGAGDVNGDGYDDLLIGAPENSTAGNYAGAAYLVLGSDSPSDLPLSAANATKYSGEALYDKAGYSLTGAGDVDGDGYADLLIGAYENDAGGADAGAAYLVLGSVSPSDLTLNVTNTIKYSGEATPDWAGHSVAGAGDVDGDGYHDLLIGAYGNDGGGSDAGVAYLVFSDALSQDHPSFQHRHRLRDNSGDALHVDFDQAGVRVDFTAGALSGGSISVRRHTFHPCSTHRRLAIPIWTLESNKVGASASINLRFEYTDAQIAGMTESSLKLWTRSSGEPCSTWTEVSGSSVDAAHNFVSATVSSLSQFTIGESQPGATAVRMQSFRVLRAEEPAWLVILTALLVIGAAVSYAYLRRQGVSLF